MRSTGLPSCMTTVKTSCFGGLSPMGLCMIGAEKLLTTSPISVPGKLRYTSNFESLASSSGRQPEASSAARPMTGNKTSKRSRFFICAQVHVIRYARVKRTIRRSTIMQLTWLGIAIAATVAYHIVLKLTPAGANPYLSLAATYTVVTAAFAAVYLALPGPATLREAIGQLNWTAPVLGVVVVFLD